jgi:hypothetical protein
MFQVIWQIKLIFKIIQNLSIFQTTKHKTKADLICKIYHQAKAIKAIYTYKTSHQMVLV